jgi:hypothetical protein
VPKKYPLTDREVAFLKALGRRGVPFLVVGLSAAAMQGAPVVTRDIDLWFKKLPDPKLLAALKETDGIYVPPFGMNPPQLAGEGFELFDIVLNVSGLQSFEKEFKKSRKIRLGSLTLNVLSIDRILKSKTAAGREKDLAALPILKLTLKTIRSRKSR